MKTSFYLVVRKNGTTKTVKSKPGLNWDEVSIKLDLVLPDSLFQKPQLTASINVPEDKVSPIEISSETVDNIKTAIEQHIGIPVSINIVNEQL